MKPCHWWLPAKTNQAAGQPGEVGPDDWLENYYCGAATTALSVSLVAQFAHAWAVASAFQPTPSTIYVDDPWLLPEAVEP